MVIEYFSLHIPEFMQWLRRGSKGELSLSLVGNMQMFIGKGSYAATPGCPRQEAKLHEIRLINVLKSDSLFVYGRCEGFKAYRATFIEL